VSKTILTLLLVIILTGGGVAFAEYSPADIFAFAGGADENEGISDSEERSEVADAVIDTLGEGSEPGYDSFGQTVSSAAKKGGHGEAVSEAARSVNNEVETGDEDGEDLNSEGVNNEENGEDEGERSEVATAVLETLGEGSEPGDDSFGQAVSSAAKEGGLGPSVSEAARNAAGGGKP
jgi:hypothetical protein